MVGARTAVAGRSLLATAAASGSSRGSICIASRASSSKLAYDGIRIAGVAGARRMQSTEAYDQGGSDDLTPPMTTTRQIPSRARGPALRTRVKPVPSSFYTGQPVYTDSLITLEELTRQCKRALELANIPLGIPTGNEETRRTLFWLRRPDLSARLSIPLRTSHYRNIVSRLQALVRLRPALQEHFITGAHGEANRHLAEEVEKTLRSFARDNVQLRGGEDGLDTLPSYVGVDDKGRAYARGRRKESSARVWIVPTKESAKSAGEGQPSQEQAAISNSILINAQPISEFFSRPADREAAVYPLRLAGLLGTFNVFTLVRGGGTSGQAVAIAHGMSAAIVAHFENKAKAIRDAEGRDSPLTTTAIDRAQALRRVFMKDGVLRRDPRMVERKKTGKAKARKAYTWVKR